MEEEEAVLLLDAHGVVEAVELAGVAGVEVAGLQAARLAVGVVGEAANLGEEEVLVEEEVEEKEKEGEKQPTWS